MYEILNDCLKAIKKLQHPLLSQVILKDNFSAVFVKV